MPFVSGKLGRVWVDMFELKVKNTVPIQFLNLNTIEYVCYMYSIWIRKEIYQKPFFLPTYQ